MERPPHLDDDSDDFDELPSTHLDDDAYDDFLAKEFDREGRLRDGPPVGFWIGVIIAVLVAVALAVAL